MRARGTRLGRMASVLAALAAAACGFDGLGTGPPEIVAPPAARSDAATDAAPDTAPMLDSAPDARPAALQEFCAKCAECVEVISDDFCDPFITVGATKTFDLAACSANGALEDAGPVAAAVLAGWTCKEFDDHL